MSFQIAVTVLQRVRVHRARKWQGRKLTRQYILVITLFMQEFWKLWVLLFYVHHCLLE